MSNLSLLIIVINANITEIDKAENYSNIAMLKNVVTALPLLSISTQNNSTKAKPEQKQKRTN